MEKFTVNNKWVHFIGIGGVTMAPLAVEFVKKGLLVTGSDKDLFDPIKTFLQDSKIKINKGFVFNNLIDNNQLPGLVICSSSVSLKNKEYLFAKKQGIHIEHYPQVLLRELIVPDSIVVAGTYGKSTITAMLVDIFKRAGKNISYMFGALPIEGSQSVILKDDSTEFSVVEGDEYISSRWDGKSKFFYYKPKYLLLASLKWDHTDVFKTEQEYVENFKNLVDSMSSDGLIFANNEDAHIQEICADVGTKCVMFDFKELKKWGEENQIKTTALGDYNYRNALVAAKFATYFDINLEVIKEALLNFKGLKRRLEIRYASADSKYVVIDDFASSPAKVTGSIKSLKKEFPDHKLTIIFEPNTGSRTKASLNNYIDVFNGVDYVLLPKFAKLIKSKDIIIDEKVLAAFLKKNDIHVSEYSENKDLIDKLSEIVNDGGPHAFVFMSSQGMEPLIQKTIELLNK